MALWDQFKTLQQGILHRVPLPKVDVAVRELKAETFFNLSHPVPSSQYVFVKSPTQLALLPTPSVHLTQLTRKSKPRFGMDECNFGYKKGYWNNTCLKLATQNRQSFSQPTYHPPSILETSASSTVYPSTLQFIIEQLQSIIASYSVNQPQACVSTIHSSLYSSSLGVSPTSWIFDSGSSNHMTPNLSSLSNYVYPSSPITIAIANGSPMHVISIGFVLPSPS